MRHPGLQDLSRDHHVALLHAKRLYDGAHAPDGSSHRAARSFLSWWQGSCLEHLAEEEAFVHPRHPDVGFTARLRAAHNDLREQVDFLRIATTDANMLRPACLFVAESLRNHVRLSEWELFEDVQDALKPPQMLELATALRGYRAQRRPRAVGPNPTEACYLE